MTDQRDSKVWVEGHVVDGHKARISVFDHGLLYGDGLFEGIRIHGGGIFRLPDHLRRFAAGAKALGLTLPGGLEKVESIVLETARAYQKEEGYIRLLATRGCGELGVDPTTCESPQLICIAKSVSLYPVEKLESGIELITSSFRRPSLDALDPAIKSLNYLNNVLAKREARLRGADEALLLNSAGMVAEASVANLFVVHAGHLSTPNVTDGALPGITRWSIATLATELGIPFGERSLGRQDLFSADEVFLTGTGAGIVPVASFDGAEIGLPGRGPVTRRLSEGFSRFMGQNLTPF
ncbi:MAG: branched-chain-amino-acid transaminase [Deltaproteobacteria bacterium]|nr:branched-chain-amino-acid transaminase [Deltaproteobacteria bacterium]